VVSIYGGSGSQRTAHAATGQWEQLARECSSSAANGCSARASAGFQPAFCETPAAHSLSVSLSASDDFFYVASLPARLPGSIILALIPDEHLLMFSGPEWLLQVIGASTKEEAGRLILILWRAWFVRNEWTHAGRWVGGGRVDQVSDKLLGVPGGKLLAGRR